MSSEAAQFFYVPMHIQMWSDVEANLPFKVKWHADFGDGFIPVFLSEEELKRHYPESEGWTYGKFAKVMKESDSVGA